MSELQDFVLNFYRVNGALVDPPSYGAHEVLLPDVLAEQLDAPILQEIVFDLMGPTEDDGRLYLTQGHPLVERLVEQARRASSPAQAYINNVRLDKRGLAELARRTLTFPNARLVKVPDRKVSPALFHYLLLTFKVTLTTDERHEQLASVAMDGQAGWAVNWQNIRERAPLDEEPDFGHLPVTPPYWIDADQPFTPASLASLLERAQCAVLQKVADTRERLCRRSARYLELDQARLESYYADMERDLRRRLQRADDDRRAALRDKIISVQAERRLKLADAENRYRLRTDLELVTAQVIVQPKLTFEVQIVNRGTFVQRWIVWDPLLHCIEPLRCDVCGLPGMRLHLCNGGHLAHSDCLLEQQCVDCKRVYCRLCQEQMSTCVVCGRPVCLSSLNICSECGRGTCREHRWLCHAGDGMPIKASEPSSDLDRKGP